MLLSLKRPLTLHAKLGGIKLELTWKPPPQGLALIVSERIMQRPRMLKKEVAILERKSLQDISKGTIMTLTS